MSYYEFGLSPRVRGNPSENQACLLVSGSIPACTGKPLWPSAGQSAGRVYPRVYGETTGSRQSMS